MAINPLKYPQQAVTVLISYVEAVKLIFTSTMWLAFLVPLGLSIGLYFGGEVLLEDFQKTDLGDLDQENASKLLTIGLQAIAIYATVHMTRYLVLTLLTPILTPLSTRAEHLITGNTYPLIIKWYIEDIVRAWKIIIRNMLLQMAWMAGLYTLTFIYGLPDWVDQIGYYVIACYFYGFSFMDYANERRRLSIPDSVKFTRQHAGAAYMLGLIYAGMWQIPYAGVVLAPILAVVAGTIAVHKMVDLSKNPYAVRPGQDQSEADRDNEARENGEGESTSAGSNGQGDGSRDGDGGREVPID